MIHHGQVEIELDEETLSLPGTFNDKSMIVTFGSFPISEVGNMGVAGAVFSLRMTVDTDTDDVVHYFGSGTPVIVEEIDRPSRRYRVEMKTNLMPIS